MSEFIRSKKFTGVSYKLLKHKDRSYYIDYKLEKKFKRTHIGKQSEGINEAYCHQLRNEAINRHKFGDDRPVVKGKNKEFLSLDNLADKYFSDKEGENKENTRQKAKYILHIKPLFGQADIENLEQEDILEFRNHLKSTPIKSRKKTLPAVQKDVAYYRPETINGIIKLFSRIINYSIKNKKLKIINPCIGISKLKVDNARERFLSLHEINLLKTVVKNDPVTSVFVHLSLITGGRESTIMNIQYKDINLEQGLINLYDFKNDSSYTGFLDDEVKILLEKSIHSHRTNSYVVGGQTEKFQVRTIQNRLKKTFDELFNNNLEKKDTKNRTVIHTLRHTFASQLAIQGTPIFTIQKLMNHADIEQTMRYAKLAPDSGKAHVINLYRHK